MKYKRTLREQNDRSKSNWIILCVLQSLYWATMTLHSSFLVFFLKQSGYTLLLISYITILMTLINLIAQPVWGYIADITLSIKKIIRICLLGSIPVLLFLPDITKYFGLMLLSNIVYASFNYPLQGLTDSITSIASEKNVYVEYGFTRGCGSFSSAIVSLIVGYVLNFTQTRMVFILEAGMLLLAFCIMGMYSDSEKKESDRIKTREQSDDSIKSSIISLVKNRKYIMIIVSITLINTCSKATLFFVPILIDKYGGNSIHLGYSLFLNCIFMAPCMILHSRLIKRGVSNSVPLIIGGIICIFKALLMSVSYSLFFIILLQVFQSFSYGLIQPSTVTAAGDASSIEIRATAITIAIAATTVFSTFMGQNVASILADIVGINTTLFLSMLVSIAGVFLYMLTCRDKKIVSAL